MNPHTHQITSPQPFARRLLTRAKGHPDVEEVTPLYMGTVKWRDPWTKDKQPLFVYGVVPYSPAISAPGVMELASQLHETDTCLFDAMSRKEFGQVAARVAGGELIEAEINGLRRVKVVGTTKIGANFAVDGNMVTSDVNFLRLFPARPPGSVDLGVIRLRKAAPLRQVQAELAKVFGVDLMVLSVKEMMDRETEFLLKSRPINFIFTLGAAVGFLVGFAIVYQVLFTDVNNHLAAIRDAQGNRLFRWLSAAGRDGRVVDSVASRLCAGRGAGVVSLRVRGEGHQLADEHDSGSRAVDPCPDDRDVRLLRPACHAQAEPGRSRRGVLTGGRKMNNAMASIETKRAAYGRRHAPAERAGHPHAVHGGYITTFDENEPAIRMRALDYAYDEGGRPHQVLFGLNLDIQRGEVVLLTGPSGCGKTTLLTLIGGLRSVEAGELSVLGHELHACEMSDLVQVRRSIGFIFQMHNLLDFLTARQNVQMALQLHPELPRARDGAARRRDP